MGRICKLTSGSVVLALALATFSTSSFAVGTPEQRAACTPDAFRLCSSEIPNIPKITACMMKHRADLSSGCRSVMDRDLAASKKKVASADQTN